jgi:hypothetical protein
MDDAATGAGSPSARPSAPRWRARLRRALLLAVGLLYLLSVPWYRAADPRPGLLFGLPDWVAVAIGCYALAALGNAAAWLLADLPEREEDEAER